MNGNFMWDLLFAPLGNIGTTPITAMRLLGLVFIVVVTWRLSTAMERQVVALARNHHDGHAQYYGFIRLGRYLIWIASMLIGLSYLGFDLGSLAIIGGAVGLGVGFGLQTLISNLVSGIIILMERTLKVGDFIDLQSGVMGRVTEIGMRYTRVVTNDNVNVIVPNAEFINGRVVNWTMNDVRRLHVSFGVAYGVDKSKVREAGLAAAARVEGVLSMPGKEADVWLVRFGESSLDFELVVWVEKQLSMVPQAINARLMWFIEDELRDRGIEIPFPQRDLHIRSGVLNVKRVDDPS